MNFYDKYMQWCEDTYFDENTRKELIALSEEIKDRFYKDLEFGTGGLRGVIGMGTNRMNIYTVRKASQGLADFVNGENGAEQGIVIAYDSRNMSPEFALEVALCFCANGIKTYLFESLRPTPELSFSIRALHCKAGVVITASHNPAEYNGYKVYWEDGAQITPPKDTEIINCINAVKDYKTVKTMDKADAVNSGMLIYIGENIDKQYLDALKTLIINKDVIQSQANELKIVYTPLHGTGNIPVRRILKEIGFNHVYVVEEQENPDGNFPTVPYPNPEDKRAFDLALKLAKEKDADIVLATDPDADRLGIYVKNNNNDYIAFTGNMSGILICDYIMSQLKERDKLPKDGAIVTTIVSSDMSKAVAKKYNVDLIETLTGFKYIGEQIKLFEENKNHTYLFGYEESYGCLVGTYARDKDAIGAVMMICEAAAYYKSRGLNLWEQMLNLYNEYGYYKEDLFTITLKGENGAKQINKIMDKFRTEKIECIEGFEISEVRDYKNSTVKNLKTGNISSIDLPKSNVIYLDMQDNSWCCIRPSGTEPKIKFYIGVKGNDLENADKKLMLLKDWLISIIGYCEQ